MTPASAVGIIAAAVGLFCLTFRPIRPLARLIGFALIVLGLAVLSEDLFGFSLGIDQALVRGDSIAAGAAQAGKLHMAPGVTGSLILFGLALLYAKQGSILSAFSQILALIILAQVLIVLAGHAYGVATYDYPFPFTQMSLYGASYAVSCLRSGCSPPRPNTASPPPSSSSRRPARCCAACCPASWCCRW